MLFKPPFRLVTLPVRQFRVMDSQKYQAGNAGVLVPQPDRHNATRTRNSILKQTYVTLNNRRPHRPFAPPPPFSCKVCRDAPLCRCRKRPLSKHGNAPLSSVCPPAPAKTTMALVFMLCLQGWLSTRAPSLPGPARPSRPARPPLHKNCLSAEPTGGGGRVF